MVLCNQSVTTNRTFTRRTLLARGGQGLLASALAQTLWTHALLADTPTAELAPWIDRLYAAAEELRKGDISPAVWQLKMDLLYAQVDIAALLRNVDFDRLQATMNTSTKPEVFVGTPLRGEQTEQMERQPLPGQLNLINKIAHVKKGKCIPPHGHSNMVSAFLVVSGSFRARQFDCLRWHEAAGTMWVLPAMDVVQSAGQWTSISDERCNAHWLEALSDDTYLFSTKMAHLRTEQPTRGRIPFDFYQARDVARGVIEVPVISGAEADRIYNG